MRKIAIILVAALMFTLIGCTKTQTETPPKTDTPVIIEKSEDEQLLEKVDLKSKGGVHNGSTKEKNFQGEEKFQKKRKYEDVCTCIIRLPSVPRT